MIELRPDGMKKEITGCLRLRVATIEPSATLNTLAQEIRKCSCCGDVETPDARRICEALGRSNELAGQNGEQKHIRDNTFSANIILV